MGIKVMKEINGKLNTNKNKIYHFIKERKLVFPLLFCYFICSKYKRQFVLFGRTMVLHALNRRRSGLYRLVIGRLRQRCILRICPSRAEADA